jgi:hypothetical protein
VWGRKSAGVWVYRRLPRISRVGKNISSSLLRVVENRRAWQESPLRLPGIKATEVTIEELLPSLAPAVHRSEGATDKFVDSARELMGLLRDLVHCPAFLLSSWDPLSNSHRHQALVSEGYSDETISHVNDEYVGGNPAFKVSHTQCSRSLRWRDYERDWNVYFQDTRTAQEFLIPAGFHEGTTVCLRLPNGRYTGAVHMSWTSPAAATDERREIIERFRSVLAMTCDLLRAPQLLASTLNPDAVRRRIHFRWRK